MLTLTSIVSTIQFVINLPIVQYYCPPASQVNKDFLKAVFCDEKKLFKKNQVNFIHVPAWDELAVKKLWPDMKKDAKMSLYFQDDYADERGPCREYFFNILNTVYPDYLTHVMSHAAKERFSVEGKDNKAQAIKGTNEWFDALNNLPFKSSKLNLI